MQRQLHCRRSALVPYRRIRPVFQQRLHRARAPRPHRAMQSCSPVHILSVYISTGLNRTHNRRRLRLRVPPRRTRTPESRRMKWLGATPVPRSNIRPRLNQPVRHRLTIRSCRKMQRRIARIDVVPNFRNEKRTWPLPSRSLAKTRQRKLRRGLHQSRKKRAIAGCNRVNQRSQKWIAHEPSIPRSPVPNKYFRPPPHTFLPHTHTAPKFLCYS